MDSDDAGTAYSWSVVGNVNTASSPVDGTGSMSSLVPTDIISGEWICKDDNLPMSWVMVAEKISFRTLLSMEADSPNTLSM